MNIDLKKTLAQIEGSLAGDGALDTERLRKLYDLSFRLQSQILAVIRDRESFSPLPEQERLAAVHSVGCQAVYGSSLAAHIKKHRMEQAAKLLRETDMSIAEIAQAVGYDSQSKFASAFKAFFRFCRESIAKTVVIFYRAADRFSETPGSLRKESLQLSGSGPVRLCHYRLT